MFRNFWFYFIALLLSSCASSSWEKFPIKTQPDVSCNNGSGEAGYQIFVWNCLENERVVIYQWQSGLYKYPSKIEKSPCGKKTQFEKNEGIEQYSKEICRIHPPNWPKNP